jgi:pimeloyl-ACP methyl ester carboxylesterase
MFTTRIVSRPSPRAWLLATVAGAVAFTTLLVATGSAAPSAAADKGARPKPTVVLVHGAWADASGRSGVVRRLQREGYPPFGATDVDVYPKADMFRATFAADVSEKDAAVMAAVQRPLALPAGAEPTTATAWTTIRSWALVGLDDKAITPEQQLFMARRAGAEIVQIHSSHVAMISHPGAVTNLIESAANATEEPS